MKFGLVGLGRLGRAIQARLAASGYDVIGWDRDAVAMKPAAGNGMQIAAHPRAVADGCDGTVISIITEDNGVKNIFRGEDGFLSGDMRGKLFIEMSTLQPMTGRELAPVVEAAGARLIDSPVLGTIPSVRDGKLFALVGGKPEDLDAARPVLEKLTRKITHMRPNGAGYAMKLAVNLGLGAYIEALAESLALGAQQGLALDQMLDVLLEAPTATNWLAAKIPVLRGQKAEVTLDLRTLRKDVMSAVATGALLGVPMPVASGTLAALSAAVAGGAGDGDLAELAQFMRTSMLQNFG
jgi:3-hydroxyisobutyrate dehydrogenase-like beta-hydroxyacid dehydrogenase